MQVWAKASASSSPSNSIICLLRTTASESQFLKFQMRPLGSRIERIWGEGVILSRSDPPSGAEFVVTFVQDFETQDGPKWTLYLGEDEAGYSLFTDAGELLPDSASVRAHLVDATLRRSSLLLTGGARFPSRQCYLVERRSELHPRSSRRADRFVGVRSQSVLVRVEKGMYSLVIIVQGS